MPRQQQRPVLLARLCSMSMCQTVCQVAESYLHQHVQPQTSGCSSSRVGCTRRLQQRLWQQQRAMQTRNHKHSPLSSNSMGRGGLALRQAQRPLLVAHELRPRSRSSGSRICPTQAVLVHQQRVKTSSGCSP